MRGYENLKCFPQHVYKQHVDTGAEVQLDKK